MDVDGVGVVCCQSNILPPIIFIFPLLACILCYSYHLLQNPPPPPIFATSSVYQVNFK